jgi:hypothetical protein
MRRLRESSGAVMSGLDVSGSSDCAEGAVNCFYRTTYLKTRDIVIRVGSNQASHFFGRELTGGNNST